MKKKLTALGLVVAVVASLFAGMTLTYFTDKDTVTNTFTVGDVDIKVYETGANGRETEEGRLYENVVPGVSYTKDPTIKNTGSNPAYVRMLVTVPKDLFDFLASKQYTDLSKIFDGHSEEEWAFAGLFASDEANTMTYAYNYNRTLTPGSSATLFTSFTLPSGLTQEDLAAWDSFYIVVEGQAIQAEGLTKDEAFGKLETVSGVIPGSLVHNDAELKTALSVNSETIVLSLMADVSYDVGAWGGAGQTTGYEMGGTNTKSIMIFGNGHKLTFKNTNSDWNNIVTNGAKLTIFNATLDNDGYGANDGPWNQHDLNFNCDVEFNKVTFTNAVAVHKSATFKNCSISDTNVEADTYMLWICAGADVTIDGITINGKSDVDLANRAIAIKDQYINNPAKTYLTVKNATITSDKKSAVIVTSTGGTEITWDTATNDISGCADSANPVTVDDGAAYKGLNNVKVNGVQAPVEG